MHQEEALSRPITKDKTEEETQRREPKASAGVWEYVTATRAEVSRASRPRNHRRFRVCPTPHKSLQATSSLPNPLDRAILTASVALLPRTYRHFRDKPTLARLKLRSVRQDSRRICLLVLMIVRDEFCPHHTQYTKYCLMCSMPSATCSTSLVYMCPVLNVQHVLKYAVPCHMHVLVVTSCNRYFSASAVLAVYAR